MNVLTAHVLRVQLPEEEERDSHLQREREGLHPSRLPWRRRVGSLFQNSSLLSSRFHAVLKHFHLTPTSLPFLFLSFIIPLSRAISVALSRFLAPLGRGRHGNRLGVCERTSERERESGRHGSDISWAVTHLPPSLSLTLSLSLAVGAIGTQKQVSK